MSDIDIFPNPTNGLFIINIKSTMPVRIIVTNSSGGILTENNFIQPVIKLDLTNFPAGIYFVSILDNDRILTRKILKSN
ncbi:MAG: T9SS type A sorting domain-containing protein [Draconibacterium sp.]|nr:T9SS type A sorting domain-containing protein [Draconibacterium sp.]